MDPVLYLKALLLGLVEGLTEFLPVSSTGHLIVASDLLDFRGSHAQFFVVAIQLGAIAAVVWEYRARFAQVLSGLTVDPVARRFAINLAVALAPAIVLGLLFHRFIKTYLFSPLTVAAALIGGAFVILAVERKTHTARVRSIDDMRWPDALKIGLAQSVAMFPGVSRSGATIMGGMLLGLSRETATLFSFFLAVPTMLAAVSYETYKSWSFFAAGDVGLVLTGFVAAFAAARLTVRALLAYVASHDFRPFAWYRIAFGVAVLLTWAAGLVDWREV